MIKRARRKSMFQLKIWYERFYVISKEAQTLQVFKRENGGLSVQIPRSDMIGLQDINSQEPEKTTCPYKWSFLLVTKERTFHLHARLSLERDHWVKAF